MKIYWRIIVFDGDIHKYRGQVSLGRDTGQLFYDNSTGMKIYRTSGIRIIPGSYTCGSLVESMAVTYQHILNISNI